MLLSSFFARSMAFTHTPRVQLPFALFSETFLTIRQNSLYVTVCIIARPSYRGYFIHSLSTLHYCNAPSFSFFARSMAFTHTPRVQLPFALFSETFLTIRQNSLYVTVCIIARPSYRGYFIHSLSTLHYCNAPSLATRLTGDYRDRTYTG